MSRPLSMFVDSEPSSRRIPQFAAFDSKRPSPTPSLSLPPLTPSGYSSSSNNSSDECEELGDYISRRFSGNWGKQSVKSIRSRRALRTIAIDIPERKSSVLGDDASPTIDDCSIVVDDIFGISVPPSLAEKSSLRSPVVDIDVEAPELFHDACEWNGESRAASPQPVAVPSTPRSTTPRQRIRRKPVPVYDPAEFEGVFLAGSPASPRPRQMAVMMPLPPLVPAAAPPGMVVRDVASRSPSAAERANSYATKLNSLSRTRTQALQWWARA